jgi:hypothetical protein
MTNNHFSFHRIYCGQEEKHYSGRVLDYYVVLDRKEGKVFGVVDAETVVEASEANKGILADGDIGCPICSCNPRVKGKTLEKLIEKTREAIGLKGHL